MWNYKYRSPRTLFEALIERAYGLKWAYGLHTPERYRKPGELITQLPEEDRKLLQELTVKDFDHRIDAALQYQGVPKVLGHRGRYSKEVEAARAHKKDCKCCKKCNWCRQDCNCVE